MVDEHLYLAVEPAQVIKPLQDRKLTVVIVHQAVILKILTLEEEVVPLRLHSAPQLEGKWLHLALKDFRL